MPLWLREYAGWYFRVNVCGRLLRRESYTYGQVGELPAHCVGGEEGGFMKYCERWAWGGGGMDDSRQTGMSPTRRPQDDAQR